MKSLKDRLARLSLYFTTLAGSVAQGPVDALNTPQRRDFESASKVLAGPPPSFSQAMEAGATYAKWSNYLWRAAQAPDYFRPRVTPLVNAPTLAGHLVQNASRFLFSPASDTDVYGVRDYWAGPHEVLTLGGGDDEDMAITKYHACRAVGIPAERLWITVAKDQEGQSRTLLLVDTWTTVNQCDFKDMLALDATGGAQRFRDLGYKSVEMIFNEDYFDHPGHDGVWISAHVHNPRNETCPPPEETPEPWPEDQRNFRDAFSAGGDRAHWDDHLRRATQEKPFEASEEAVRFTRIRPRAMLNRINNGVNKILSCRHDNATFNMPEFWGTMAVAMGLRVGDCDEFATSKYGAARPLFPVDKLFVAAVGTSHEEGANHLVLLFDPTPLGEQAQLEDMLTLDNNGPILPFGETGYSIYEMFNEKEFHAFRADTQQWESFDVDKPRIANPAQPRMSPGRLER